MECSRRKLSRVKAVSIKRSYPIPNEWETRKATSKVIAVAPKYKGRAQIEMIRSRLEKSRVDKTR